MIPINGNLLRIIVLLLLNFSWIVECFNIINIDHTHNNNNNNKDEVTNNPNSSDPPKVDILVLICTQSFTAETFVEDILLDPLVERGWNVHAALVDEAGIDWTESGQIQETSLIKLSTLAKSVLIVASTYADGDPPNHANEFANWLARALSLSEQEYTTRSKDDTTANEEENEKQVIDQNLKYAVFGLGDSSYVHYCAFGKFIDSALYQRGGTRLVPLQLGDALEDPSGAFRIWVDLVLAQLSQILPPVKKKEQQQQATNNNVPYFSSTGFDWRRSAIQKDARVTTFQGMEQLLPESAARSVIHVTLRIPTHQINIPDFQPGDNVGIYPQNDAKLVYRALEWLHMDAESPTKIVERDNDGTYTPKQISAFELLSVHVDLAGRATPSTLRALLPFVGTLELRALARDLTFVSVQNNNNNNNKTTTCESPLALEHTSGSNATATTTTSGDDIFEKWVAGRRLSKLDLAIIFECRPSLQALARAIGPLQPRLYSVATIDESATASSTSTSTSTSTTDIGLCISLAEGGLCSNYVTNLAPSSHVTVFFRKSKFHFLYPSNEEEAEEKATSTTANPMIMIGAGSGIGPYIGFLKQALQKRTQLDDGNSNKNETTKNIMTSPLSNTRIVLGSRSPLEILYKDRLELYESMGTQIRYAFSRVSGQPKWHAQDILTTKEFTTIIWNDIFQNEHGRVYVCGRLELCRDVKNNLVNIVRKELGRVVEDQQQQQQHLENEAYKLVEKLEKEGRLLTDCWSVEDPPPQRLHMQSTNDPHYNTTTHVISRLERHHHHPPISALQNNNISSSEVDVSKVRPWPSYLRLVASGEFERRIEQATNMYSACVSCGRFCEVDRLSSDRDDWGECRVGDKAIVSAVDAHFGEEACLKGINGSGTIFFGSCNLKCIYCQNWKISAKDQGQVVDDEQLANYMLQLQERGCHNINFVSPTHNVLAILRGAYIAAKKGLTLPLVWNTGGYDSVASLRLLEGIVDIYMPDAKYASRAVARKLSKIDNYAEINQAAIKEMHRQVGDLQIDPRTGLAWRGVLVRHLVLPSDYAGTQDVADFLRYEVSENTFMHVMDQYRPEHEAASDTKFGLHKKPSTEELLDAHKKARFGSGLRRLYPENDIFAKARDNIAHNLAQTGKTAQLILLLDEKPELVHSQDANKWTPLHEGVRANHIEVARALVERGANINALTKNGLSALELAEQVHGKDSDICKFLKDSMAYNQNDCLILNGTTNQ